MSAGAAAPARLSVLIVSYGVRDLLARCLASLEGGAAPVEVVVADNASPDGSAPMVRERFPAVRLLEMGANRGFSAAVNAAARAATGQVLLILNPDTEVPPGGLAQMLGSLDRLPGAWALGVRQVDPQGRFQLSFGLTPGLLAELARRTVQRQVDRGGGPLVTALDRVLSRPVPIPWVSGATLLVRRHAFERVGGFDERFFLYFEDIDFCLRLRAAGGRVWYDPTLTVVHHRGASMAGAQELAARAYRESQLVFWEKHRGRWARRAVELYLRARGLAP